MSAQPETSPRALRIANVIIGVGIAIAVVNILFALQLHRAWKLDLLIAMAGLFLAAAYKLRPLRRLQVAFVVVAVTLALYGLEWRMASKRPYDATYASRRGVTFDTRSLWEKIRDDRREGRQDTYPSMMPHALLVLDIAGGLDADEIASHTVSKDWGVVIGDRRVLPLAGISDRTIVICNEGGEYATYRSDERGFNNPKGIWGLDTVDVALLGDSFTQGDCVGEHETTAAWIRKRYPATLNLGMAGNGPILELAGLEEYLATKKPKIVLWVYYANDMGDLDVEKQSSMLRRYVDEEGFSQGLAAMQEGIDGALLGLADQVEKRAPSWPGWLSGVGLTRRASPVWLGDLAMGETHSSASAVMRLDRLSWAVSQQLGYDYAHAPLDIALFKSVLTRARDRVSSWGGKLHFVYMADLMLLTRARGPKEHPTRQPVLAAAREVGLPVIDTQPAFVALPEPLKMLAHPESHCNADGYRLVAETILSAL